MKSQLMTLIRTFYDDKKGIWRKLFGDQANIKALRTFLNTLPDAEISNDQVQNIQALRTFLNTLPDAEISNDQVQQLAEIIQRGLTETTEDSASRTTFNQINSFFLTPENHSTLKPRGLVDIESLERVARKLFPQRVETPFIQLLLTDSDEFTRLIKNFYDFQCAIKLFPQQKDTLMRQAEIHLIQPLLTNPAEFTRLILNPHGLIPSFNRLAHVTSLFPQQKDTLMRQAEIHLIQPLLTNPAEFTRLIRSLNVLEHVTKLLPRQADALIQTLLTKPAEFRRLIRTSFALEWAARLFPQHPEIFGKPSVAEAYDALLKRLSSSSEIRKNARLLAQGGRNPKHPNGKFCFFSKLPEDVLKKIAALTGNPEAHSEKEAGIIAREEVFWGRPLDRLRNRK